MGSSPAGQAEREWVFALLRGGGAEAPQAAGGALDWGQVREIAAGEEVLPWLYQRLQAAPGMPGEAGMPGDARAALGPLYQANALRNLALARRLVQVSTLLEGEGIAHRAYKGPALAVQAYGDLCSRQFQDLDLLIEPQDFSRTSRLLREAGWAPHVPLSDKEERWLLRTAIEFPFHKGEAHLEIHWALSLPDFFHPLRLGRFWEETVTVDLLGKPLRTFSPANAALFTCLHAARHGWGSLKWAADLAAYRGAHPALDWLALLEASRAVGFQRFVCLGMLLAEHFCGAQFPEAVEGTLQEDGAARRMAKQVIARHQAGASLLPATQRLAFYFRGRERPADRLYMLLAQAFLPKEVDWRTIPLPEGLFGLYYLIHPLRMVVRILQTMIESLKARFRI